MTLDDGRAWFGRAWGGAPESRGLDATGILNAAAEGRIQALVLLGSDPVDDFPDRQLARQALAGAGFVVAVDAFLTASSRQADVVLPAAAYAERPGTTTNIEGRITRLGQKIVPAGMAWPDWMIATELGDRLGADLGFESAEGIWDEIERLAPSHAGITRAVLGDRRYRDGVVAPLSAGPLASAGTPPPAVADAHGGAADGNPADEHPPRPPLLRYSPDPDSPPVPALDSYSLRLVTGRTLYGRATLVQQAPSLAKLAPQASVRANPSDLARIGLAEGGRLRLRSQRAAVLADAVPDAGVPRGSIWFAFNAVTSSGDGPGDLIDAGAVVTDVRVETP